MGRNKFFLWLILLITVEVSFAQVNRYMVFLIDKAGTHYTIERPEEFLSQRAIQRRITQHIDVVQNDLPISQDYVNDLKARGVEIYYQSKWFNAVLIQEDASLIPEIQTLEYVSRIEFVAPGERLIEGALKSGRTKSFLNRLKSAKETSAQNGLLSIDEMHNEDYLGQGMMIGVFDGGFERVDEIIAFDHIFSDNRLIGTYDFVTNSKNVFQFDDHGTRVLSAIGGLIDSQFTGTAPESTFLLCVTEDVESEYRIEEYNWLFAAELADSIGIDVINTSLGFNLFDDSSMDYNIGDLDGETAVITRAANFAGQKGIMIIASAGNEGNNSWGKITPPADSPYVLAVGSVKRDLNVSSFSSLGPTADGRIKPDVVALGSSVTVIGSSGNVITASGTSFSAPLIAGLAAGVWQADRSLTNLELIENLKLSGSNANNPDSIVGYGIPDFISSVGNTILSVDEVVEEQLNIYPNPFTGRTFMIDLTGGHVSGVVEISLFDMMGNLIAQKVIEAYLSSSIVEFDTGRLLNTGLYLLRLSAGERSVEVRLIKN